MKKYLLKLLAKKEKPKEQSLKFDPEYIRIRKDFDTLHYWTPELIEWIGKENDPIKLACTAHLINCYKWPDYLPSKPENFDAFDYLSEEGQLRLHFNVELLTMLERKADIISPGLKNKIWLTQYYDRMNNHPLPNQNN